MLTSLALWQPVIGIGLLTIFAWLSSGKASKFPFKLVLFSIGLQFVLAVSFLYLPPMQWVLEGLNAGVMAVDQATTAGTQMVFGYLGGGEPPFDVIAPHHQFILAFKALPIVIVFSSLFALLWYWRIIPLVIQGFAWLLHKSMGIRGAVGLGAAASVFVGMVEAPMVIRQKLQHLTRSEFFVLITCGMATVAGTVMGLYAVILASVFEEALIQILIASVLSVPAGIMVARLMVPEEVLDNSSSTQNVQQKMEKQEDKLYESAFHAITQGAQDGMKLLLNIIALLIVFVAFVHLVNLVLAFIPWGESSLSLERLGGFLLRPVMWLVGIPWHETAVAGELFAVKIVLNEFVAYLQLAQLSEAQLSSHSQFIMIYILCGFANFSGLGILLGGLLVLCPERRQDILSLAPRTLISGNITTCLTGCVIGIVITIIG